MPPVSLSAIPGSVETIVAIPASKVLDVAEKRNVPSFEVPEMAARALWALIYCGIYLRDRGVLYGADSAGSSAG